MRTKLREIRDQIRNNRATNLTLWLMFSQVLAAGVSFIVNIVAAYGLSPEQRGLLAFYLQIGYLLTTFLMLGTEKPFIARFRGTFSHAVAHLLRIVRPSYFMLAAAVIAIAVLYFFGFEALAVPFALVLLFIICNQHLRILQAAYIASGSLKPFLAVVLVTNGLTLIFALLLAALQYDNFLLWLLAYVLANTIATFFVARAVVNARRNAATSNVSVSETRRQGVKLLPASLGNITKFRPDRLLLPILASPADLGLYIVVSGALEIAVWPVQQWSDAKMREWYETKSLANIRGRIAILAKAALGVLLISIVFAVLLVFVVLWILPESYNSSLHLLLPIAIGNIIYGTTRAQQGMAIAGGRPGLVSTAEIAGLLVALGAYFFLIPLLGALGAALGSIIGNTVAFAVTELGLFRAARTQVPSEVL